MRTAKEKKPKIWKDQKKAHLPDSGSRTSNPEDTSISIEASLFFDQQLLADTDPTEPEFTGPSTGRQPGLVLPIELTLELVFGPGLDFSLHASLALAVVATKGFSRRRLRSSR